MSTTEQEKTNAEKLAAFKQAHPDKVQVIPASNQAAVNAGTAAAEVKAQPVPERVVTAKTFPVTGFTQAGIQSFITTMSFRDVADYLEFANELYDVETDANGKAVKTKPAIEETWQRTVSTSRVKGIGAYLQNETHFLPALLCVPATHDSVQLSAADERGMLTLTVEPDGLGVLDGQHRFGGIVKALETDPNLENESIPVTILMETDLDKRQQIFADVNRTPKLVSKALNLIFDHRDPVSQLAKKIAAIPNETVPNGRWGIADHIDMESLTPKKGSNDILSFTNLHNLLKGFVNLKTADGTANMFSEELATEIVRAIVDHIPDADRIRKNQITFGQSKQEYVCYSSTFWQAFSNVVRDLALAKNADGSSQYQLNDLPQVMANLIDGIGNGWKLTDKRWLDTNRPVVVGGKVGTQTGHVANATKIILEALN